MVSETNPVVSVYRETYTVFQLERMHIVTGNEYPISGDAPLRHAHRNGSW